jgi:rare lipoprotein A
MTAWLGPLILIVLSGLADGCCSANGNDVRSHESSGGEDVGDVLRGEASYYANSLAGHRTANGERYNPRDFTAASRTLPFGTRLRVTRIDTGQSVEVRVNDRGPFGQRRRILDLSRAAADKLDMRGEGHVEIEAVVIEGR